MATEISRVLASSNLTKRRHRRRGNGREFEDVGLELLQSNAGFSRNGPYSIYITSATAAQIPIAANIVYQVGNNGIACVPASLANNAMFVTKYPGVHYTPSGSLLPDGTIDDVALYGPALKASLLDAILNAGGVLRLLIVPEQDDTAATFAGNTNSVWSGPTIFGDYSMRVSEPMIVAAETFSVTRGNFVSGNIASLAASDNIDLSVNRSSADIQSRTELEIQGTSPIEVPSELEITLEGSVFARTVVTQRIELFDYDLGAWEQVDLRDASRFSDGVVNVSPTGDVSRFVGRRPERSQQESGSSRSIQDSNFRPTPTCFSGRSRRRRCVPTQPMFKIRCRVIRTRKPAGCPGRERSYASRITSVLFEPDR